MRLYHASPIKGLESIGLNPAAKPLLCKRLREKRDQFVYLGSVRYVHEQFFRYAPKGLYYLYQVNASDLTLDDSCVGEQWRSAKSINPDRVSVYGTRIVL